MDEDHRLNVDADGRPAVRPAVYLPPETPMPWRSVAAFVVMIAVVGFVIAFFPLAARANLDLWREIVERLP